MKSKILFLIIVTLLCYCRICAQSVTNGSFENWTDKYSYSDPVPYLTTNAEVYTLADSGNVIMSTDHHSGNYSARLETVLDGTDTVFGGMFIGIPNSNGIKGGTPLVTHPDSIEVYAKFDIKTNDTAFVAVIFKNSGQMIGVSEIKLTGIQNNFTKYKSPVSWGVPISTDSVIVVMTSSRLSGKKIPGSIVYYDDLSFTNSTQFPYGTFETWNAVSSNEPDNWNSFNYICSSGNYSATKTSDAYDGNWALLLKNVIILSGDTMGYITNGKFGNNGPEGGMPIYQNPNLITGYYKFLPVGTDTAMAAAFLYRYDAIHDSTISLETELIKLPPAATYTQFSITMSYNGWPLADTLNLTFASGNYQTHKQGVGSQLYIDKLEIFYVPLNIHENGLSADNVNVFPNPGNGLYNLDINLEKSQPVNLELFNENGQKVYSESLNYMAGAINTLNLSSFAEGVYFLKIISADKTFNKKLIIK